MTDEEKLSICKLEASIIQKRYRFLKPEYDELVNIGFINIATDDKEEAKKQAYLWMLNYVTHPFDPLDRRTNSDNEQRPDVDQLLRLTRLIATLPSKDIDLLRKIFWFGLTQKECACAYKVTQQSVSLRLNRILAALREQLQKGEK